MLSYSDFIKTKRKNKHDAHPYKWHFMGDPCPFCSQGGKIGTSLKTARFLETDEIESIHDKQKFYKIRPTYSKLHDLAVCCICGWWIKTESDQHDKDPDDLLGKSISILDEHYLISSLKQFLPPLDSAPLEELTSELARNWDNVLDLHPRKVEQLASEVFQNHLGCKVELTAYSNDKGIDMYAVKNNQPWAFQIKRTAKPSQGVKQVREFIGAMVVQNIPKGVFVTTANRFTQFAQNEAQAITNFEDHAELQLVDGERFKELFEIAYFEQQPPWKNIWPGDLKQLNEDIAERRTGIL